MHLHIWMYTLAACGTCLCSISHAVGNGRLVLSAVRRTAQSAVVHAAATVSHVASALLFSGMTCASAE